LLIGPRVVAPVLRTSAQAADADVALLGERRARGARPGLRAVAQAAAAEVALNRGRGAGLDPRATAEATHRGERLQILKIDLFEFLRNANEQSEAQHVNVRERGRSKDEAGIFGSTLNVTYHELLLADAVVFVEVLLQHFAELLVDEVVRLFCLAGALVEGLVDGVQLVLGEQGHLVLGNPGDDLPCNPKALGVVVVV